jgi:hypothetical protein
MLCKAIAVPRPSGLRRHLLSTLAATILTLPLVAQTQGVAGPTWVGFDDTEPGTPAEVTYLDQQSSTKRTALRVQLHGFWREDVESPDGEVYQRITVPGLDEGNVPGTPQLPTMRRLLAMATDAKQVTFTGVESIQQWEVPDIRVAPCLTEAEDERPDPTGDPGPGDTDGKPGEWTMLEEIYGNEVDWPSALGDDAAVEPLAGPVPGAAISCWPMTWNPATNQLQVTTIGEYYWDHSGAEQEKLTITKVKEGLYQKMFANWVGTGNLYPFEPINYHSRYLIVAQPWFWDTLEPFINMKKAQGYEVTVATALPDVANIRGAIADWYAAGDQGKDHYCLLVGDTNLIPQQLVTPGGENVWTDDVYGCIGPITQSKDVYVGRLSIDNETDLANQLAKIIAYQTSPVPGGRYDTALIVAHHEDAPGKYTGSHTNVLNQSYSHPPVFMSAFGAYGATDQQVSNFIDVGQFGDGLGLVAYRGHGSTSAWTGWNVADDDWHSNDVMNLANPLRPVVWAFTCTNGNIGWGWGTDQDCIAEVWMEVPNGAVASYAATRTTSTTPNHYLNERMFRAVYDWGITTHAIAIAHVEALVWVNWPGHKNPWAYLLLGDPSMTIRRDEAVKIEVFNLPLGFFLGGGDTDEGGGITIQMALEDGSVPVDALLSWHKPSFFNRRPVESQGARWMQPGDLFEATMDTDFDTPGVVTVMVRDADGNVATHEVEVFMGEAWTNLGRALPGDDEPPRLAAVGSLGGGSLLRVLLADAPPSAPAWLAFGFDVGGQPFLGGVMVPDLASGGLLPVTPDEYGNLELRQRWPDGVAPETELVLQAWCLDGTGPQGFTASNAVLGVTP